MLCTICGRPVAGPATFFDVKAEAAVVHEGRVFRAGAGQVISDWLICRSCVEGLAYGDLGAVDMAGFFRAVVNDLAKTAGRKA